MDSEPNVRAATDNHAADLDEADRETGRVPTLTIVLLIAFVLAVLYLFRYARF